VTKEGTAKLSFPFLIAFSAAYAKIISTGERWINLMLFLSSSFR
jgi:hypothetical protein